jgi:aspartyl/glutamyl-tRNA(Asn/Gln) amidotransferase C subunit
MEIKDIEKLSKLARIELTEGEKQTYLKDISAILGYVDQIKGVLAGQETSPLRLTEDLIAPRTSFVSGLKNVMRADDNGNETGVNTTALVAEFPRKESNYLKVKKILEQ